MDIDRIFFITSVTALRQPIFRREVAADLLIATLTQYRDERKYPLQEFVIMPDHLHALITPPGEISFEPRLAPDVWEVKIPTSRNPRDVGHPVHQGRVFVSPEVARDSVAGEFHESSRRVSAEIEPAFRPGVPLWDVETRRVTTLTDAQRSHLLHHYGYGSARSSAA